MCIILRWVGQSRKLIKKMKCDISRPDPLLHIIRESGIPKPRAIRILHLLEKEEILSILRRGAGRKANILIFDKLIKIIE